MIFVQQLGAIVWKDLLTEFRTKETILSMCLFSFLVVLIFNFALGAGIGNLKGLIPGILWVVFLFSGLMGLNRTFGAERDKGTFPGLLLCPLSPWGLYLAKMIVTFIFTSIMEAFTLTIFIILFNLNLLPFFFWLAIIIFLGTLGFSAIGTIFSAMSAGTKTRDMILSILVFPISVPVLIAAVKATEGVLNGISIQDIYPSLKILIAFDLIFLLIAYLTFGFIIEE